MTRPPASHPPAHLFNERQIAAALAYVGAHPGCPTSEMAEAFGLSPLRAYHLLHELEGRGLVAASRAGPRAPWRWRLAG